VGRQGKARGSLPISVRMVPFVSPLLVTLHPGRTQQACSGGSLSNVCVGYASRSWQSEASGGGNGEFFPTQVGNFYTHPVNFIMLHCNKSVSL